MNVSVKSSSTPQNNTPQNGTGTQQTVTVPQWAQGRWGQKEGGTTITSTQFLQPELNIILFCTRVLGNSVHFEGITYLDNDPLKLYVVIYKTDSPNRLKVEIYADGEPNPLASDYAERWRGY